MTKEEAKQRLLDTAWLGSNEDRDKTEEAVRVLITALEQEPCEDCISRNDAIDVLENKERVDALNPMSIFESAERLKAIRLIQDLSSVQPKTGWIPVSERLPKTDNENRINNYNVLLWVKDKTHPEKEPQIYLGKLNHVKGDDGSGNFWGIEISPCDWTIWGWCYFNEPEVIAWQPLPKPYEEG